MAVCVQTCQQAIRPARQHTRPLRAPVMAASTSADIVFTSRVASSRRSVLAGIVGFTALTAAPYAKAKSIQEAKRERDARKQAVRDAASQSREEGRSIDTGLTSDYSIPEGAQRGRNSRTVPQKQAD